MNRSKWMLALLAGGLVCAVCSLAQTGGGATPGTTAVTYDSSMPDTPFVGAWDGDQPDCSDPHAETECWKCEQSASGNSAFPVPKYWYETEVTCPKLEIKDKTHDECVCELEGTKKTVQVQATADTTDGKWRYVPKGEPGCGKDGPDNPIKFKEIKWAWKTVGRPGGDLMKIGDLATFDYVVPNGDVNISVVFKAKGIPDDSRCSAVMDGPETVGKIIGSGVPKIYIPKVSTTYPTPNPVDSLVTTKGSDAWGLLRPLIDPSSLSISGVCNSYAACIEYQIQGQFAFSATIDILSCITIADDGCPEGKKGSCFPRDKYWLDITEKHEQVHYDAYRVFVDKWNQVVMNEPLYSSYAAAFSRLKDIIKLYNAELTDLIDEQKLHASPGFKGMPTHEHNGCAWEFKTGTY